MRLLIAALLALVLVSSVAATPAQLAVRAVELTPTTAVVTWDAVPGAVLTCVYTPQQGGVCLPAGSRPRMVVRAAPGEAVAVVAQSEIMLLAAGGAVVGPPPVYLPLILLLR